VFIKMSLRCWLQWTPFSSQP